MADKIIKESPVYLNPYKIFDFDTSSLGKKFRVVSKTCDIEIDEHVKNLLDFIKKQQGKNVSFITRQYCESGYDENKVKNIIAVLFQKGLLTDKEIENKELKEKDYFRNKMKNLLIRFKLIDTEKHEKFFKFFKFTFSKAFVISVLLVIFILEALFIVSFFFMDWGKKLIYYSSFDYFYLFIIYTLALLFHEFGHIVAAKRYNSKTGGIGIGIYYYWFIAYSDVHETWNLSRRKRQVISVAGSYYNLIFLIPIYILGFYWKSAALRDFILLFHLSLIGVFNPFFKMDGYWFLCDLLGVPNLQTKIKYYISNCLLAKIFNKKKAKNPFANHPAKIKIGINLYLTIFVIFMATFLSLFFLKAIKIVLDINKEIFEPLIFLTGNFNLYITDSKWINIMNKVIRNSFIVFGAAMISSRYIWKGARAFSKKFKKIICN